MKSCDQCFVFLFLPQFDFNSENVGVVNCIDFIIKQLPIWNFGARGFWNIFTKFCFVSELDLRKLGGKYQRGVTSGQQSKKEELHEVRKLILPIVITCFLLKSWSAVCGHEWSGMFRYPWLMIFGFAHMRLFSISNNGMQ